MPASARFPVPAFTVSTGERDGLPVVGLLNVALAGYSSCGEFPWLVELEILADDSDGRGLPTPDEVEQLDAIEAQLQDALSPLGAHFIARQTWNGRRMLDFYVSNGPAARERVATLADEGALARKVTVQVSRDDPWATWMPTLERMCGPLETDRDGEDFGHELLVEIPLSSEFGSEREQEAVMALADELAAIAAESGTGTFDGYEFGEARATLFAYGRDADELFAAFVPALRSSHAARGAVITKRYGRADDPAAREETVKL